MGDKLIFCRKKGCANPVCQLHHYVPKAIGGTDSDGRVYLCEKHHDILHKMIIKQLWDFVPDDKKVACRAAVEQFGRWWVSQP